MSDPVRILLVDPDDQVASQYYSSFSLGYWRLDRAHTFAEALDLASQSIYNIAILDMRLPDASGCDAWDQLNRLHPGMLGIFTTSSYVLHTSINPSDRGILAYLLKPVRIETLFHFILQGLQLQGTAPDSGLSARLVGLNVLLSSLMQASTLNETLDAVLSHFQAVLCADWLVVSIRNGHPFRQNQLLCRPLALDEAQLTESQLVLVQQMMDEVIQARRTVLTVAPRLSPSDYFGARPEDVGLGAVMITPLVTHDRTYGALAVVNRIECEQVFTQNEIQLLSIISQVLSFKLDYAQRTARVLAVQQPSEIGRSIT